MAKAGDKVRIIANTSSHGFEIGSEATIVRQEHPRLFVVDNGDYFWWMNPDDFKVIDETGGQSGE